MALPLGTGAPTVGAEPDGEIALEWYFSPRYVLSVSVSATRELHYAASLGMRKAYGTELFGSSVPKIILELIRDVRFAGRAEAA